MTNTHSSLWSCFLAPIVFVLIHFHNTVKPVHNGPCPQRKPVINGHFVENTSFFTIFVWNRTCTQRKLSITSELFPPEQFFVQTNLFTTNFLTTFFCSHVKNQTTFLKIICKLLSLYFIPLYCRMKNQFKI
jgi:hypothetical protein